MSLILHSGINLVSSMVILFRKGNNPQTEGIRSHLFRGGTDRDQLTDRPCLPLYISYPPCPPIAAYWERLAWSRPPGLPKPKLDIRAWNKCIKDENNCFKMVEEQLKMRLKNANALATLLVAKRFSLALQCRKILFSQIIFSLQSSSRDVRVLLFSSSCNIF